MKIEGILAIIFVLVSALKFFELSGSNIIFVVTLFHISAIYLLFGFYLFSYPLSNRGGNIGFSIVSGLLLSIAILGLLFKIMHWDGAITLTAIGLSATILIFLVAYFLKSKSSSNLKIYYRNMLLRSGILIVLQLLAVLFIPE
jgi:hypothetical protein